MSKPGKYAHLAGCELLKEWLDTKGIKRKDFAELLQVDPQMISGWLSGVGRPKGLDAECVKKLCGVSPEEFMLKEELDAKRAKFARLDKLAKCKPPKEDIFMRIAGRLSSAS